jgi:hypothetical protein
MLTLVHQLAGEAGEDGEAAWALAASTPQLLEELPLKEPLPLATLPAVSPSPNC